MIIFEASEVTGLLKRKKIIVLKKHLKKNIKKIEKNFYLLYDFDLKY